LSVKAFLNRRYLYDISYYLSPISHLFLGDLEISVHPEKKALNYGILLQEKGSWRDENGTDRGGQNEESVVRSKA
jgi:hypothetical protein